MCRVPALDRLRSRERPVTAPIHARSPVELSASRGYGSIVSIGRAEFVAALPRKVAAAGALITNADGHILVVKPAYKEGWEVPGGCVEQGESAREACSRELNEELALTVPVGRLLVVEHQTVS